ncbi:Coenzyme F420 hydrogenase/dehydrogenase, beta subunit C-terminal domain [Bacteroides sp. 224]|uniref:Coenzyme F420 hydrogenase/dehydrogenase, beta subunit C-terminal domain n=1 Tax=Bacteroides sp. 224 TaxID=2302936 RepID=UPI0013D06668|nr:Coenzyme F420 hydrogenase/dehydrogenase, beta subunit C-terminal domain [Bacteroides sp. 224]NDV65186.1 4Fe-4S dicluster domain-containing protein [Bacteroides sp. 224]
MIKLNHKKDCCGCFACSTKCPQACIEMQEDVEGFLYPQINEQNCIHCSLCEKVCPVINQREEREPLLSYALKNKDEFIRSNSSSGGFFHLSAQQTIKNKGVVFGVKFNEEWETLHDYTDSNDEINKFLKSKYIQSRVNNNYALAESFLKEGKLVFFVGTPCQVSGLLLYLQKEYKNLITMDFICHGVPSSKIWKKYLEEILPEDSNILNINFRNKSKSWKRYCFSMQYTSLNKKGEKEVKERIDKPGKNLFMRGYLKDLYLRPSCYYCPTKSLKSKSDITIGDFWGIENIVPKFDDDKGCSAIMLNTEKGVEFFSGIPQDNYAYKPISYKDIVRSNKSLIMSAELSAKRDIFFKEYEQGTMIKTVKSLTSDPLHKKLEYELYKLLKRTYQFIFSK